MYGTDCKNQHLNLLGYRPNVYNAFLFDTNSVFMAKIYLVRHGQAAAGFGTHRDPGLNELGHSQAQAVASQLADVGPLPILSSPLARAYETAQPLAKTWSVEISIEKRVAEIPSPTEDLDERAQWLRQAMQGAWDDLAPTFQAWRNELAQCLTDIDTDCVIFSHYVAINAAVGVAQQDSRMLIFSPDNCSVTVLDNAQGSLSVEALGHSAQTKVN